MQMLKLVIKPCKHESVPPPLLSPAPLFLVAFQRIVREEIRLEVGQLVEVVALPPLPLVELLLLGQLQADVVRFLVSLPVLALPLRLCGNEKFRECFVCKKYILVFGEKIIFTCLLAKYG